MGRGGLATRIKRLEQRRRPPSCGCWRVIYAGDAEERPLCPHGQPWAGVVRVIYDKVPLPTQEGRTP